MTRISSLKPNVSRDQAVAAFNNPARNFFRGPLRAVADFYIPFYLFTVGIKNRGHQTSSIFGLDAVNGTLDLYRFDDLLQETVQLETRNVVPASLQEAASCELVIAKVRRVVFSSGFFRLRDLKISAERHPQPIHIPYWVGFRGANNADFVILDAVRRRVEGSKVRHIFHSWIAPFPDRTLVTAASSKVLS